jgi:hypothetical protein
MPNTFKIFDTFLEKLSLQITKPFNFVSVERISRCLEQWAASFLQR